MDREAGGDWDEMTGVQQEMESGRWTIDEADLQ